MFLKNKTGLKRFADEIVNIGTARLGTRPHWRVVYPFL